MKNSLPLKAWVIDMATHFAVTPATIWKWRKRGLFANLREQRVNARVILVSGEAVLLRRPTIGQVQRFDFSNVDWSQRSCVIARALGCHPSTVSHRRKKNLRA